ncbi:hypothetical protein JCM5296_006951 [Sporobolomyces johnsonii]
MARSEPTSADFDPARPFVCPVRRLVLAPTSVLRKLEHPSLKTDPRPLNNSQECASRYTRQEHLDRHITAKHRSAKDFVCPICSKGFARKDILKRHQQGHEKQAALAAEAAKAEASGGEGSVASSKGKKRATNHEPAGDDGSGPVKAPRVGRACARCRTSKLRCDGELPCARCQKAGIDCTFDRPTKPSTSRGESMAISDELSPTLTSSGSGGESGDLGGDYDDDFGMPILPTPPTSFDSWNRPPVSASAYPSLQASYGLAPRAGGAHHCLPPNNFLAGGASPTYYPSPANPYGYRPPPAAYSNPAMFPSLNLPHHVSSPLNPFAQPQPGYPPAPGPAPPSAPTAQYDDSSFGRRIGDASNDFLDLISSGAPDDAIDWSVLGAGFQQQGPMLGAPTGYTPREGLSPVGAGLLAAAAAAAAASQPLSDIRHNGTVEADPVASTSGEGFPAETDEDGDVLFDGAPPTVTGRHNSLIESDNAAVSLLQLASASHTPRVSPEPEVAPSSSSARKPLSITTATSRLQQSFVNPPEEDPPRLSHLAYTPSDPWPLSYRPTEPTEDILPSSARGTAYASRAASPLPGHAPSHALSHVPSVSESTRLRILYKVRELSPLSPSPSGDPSLSERFVPRLELLDLFVQLYFERYHALFPILHRGTWDPNTAPSFLVLAVASVGARYAFERVVGAGMHAHALLESARRMMQIMGDLDNTLLRTVGWQQTLLIVLMTGMISGNKRDLERTQAFSSMPVTFARRQGWLNASPVDESHEAQLPLDERWRRWRDREEIRRLGFGAIMVDCMGTALWNTENSSLFADAAATPLPCADALWDAPTSVAWHSHFRHAPLPPSSPTTSAAIHLVCSPSSAASSPIATALSRNTFALAIVLSAVHALGWAREHQTWTERTLLLSGRGEEEGEGQDPERAALEHGVEYFQDHVLLPASMLARLDDPTVTAGSGTMALMLHLTALTQRLPLRVLQPLARLASSPPSASLVASLNRWSTARSGAVARQTAYHAGQLVGLCERGQGESPLEPFALFYAGLALAAFARECGTKRAAGREEVQAAEGEGEGDGEEFALDVLRDRTDADVVAFVEATRGVIVPTLSQLGRLDEGLAGDRILKSAAARLMGLKCWKVGENLGKTLLLAVSSEQEGEGEVKGEVKEEDGMEA